MIILLCILISVITIVLYFLARFSPILAIVFIGIIYGILVLIDYKN